MKNIVIAVTGSIAAFKAAEICSNLKKYNYNITVLMSKNATKFITPLTFQSITSNKVYIDLFDGDNISVDHIELVRYCDLFLIAPATANIIAKAANGIADDFISTFLLTCAPNKVFIAPAMNTRMLNNQITKNNIEKLKKLSYNFIDTISGKLACGDIGNGKLADVNTICETVRFNLEKTNELENINILITAGSSSEKIDSVRKISNLSSGKMGYALAKAAIYKGANVFLISSEINLEIPKNLSYFEEVKSCDDFLNSINKLKDKMNVIIMSAAISDFKLKNSFDRKIKKSEINDIKFEFEINVDILKYLSENNTNNYKLIGFAAETNNILENAISKLKNKKLDYIILNDVSNSKIGFNSDYNEVTIIDKNLIQHKINMNLKEKIAFEILDYLKLQI